MTDYREISQAYAKGAITTAMAINGGAAIAVLSQFTSLAELLGTKTVAVTLLVYSFGVLFAAATWILAFLSTRYVDRVHHGQDPDYSRSDNFMHGGLIAIAASLVTFLIGALVLVLNV